MLPSNHISGKWTVHGHIIYDASVRKAHFRRLGFVCELYVLMNSKHWSECLVPSRCALWERPFFLWAWCLLPGYCQEILVFSTCRASLTSERLFLTPTPSFYLSLSFSFSFYSKTDIFHLKTRPSSRGWIKKETKQQKAQSEVGLW